MQKIKADFRKQKAEYNNTSEQAEMYRNEYRMQDSKTRLLISENRKHTINTEENIMQIPQQETNRIQKAEYRK